MNPQLALVAASLADGDGFRSIAALLAGGLVVFERHKDMPPRSQVTIAAASVGIGYVTGSDFGDLITAHLLPVQVQIGYLIMTVLGYAVMDLVGSVVSDTAFWKRLIQHHLDRK
jgi:hypothetical protein